ncbi:trehalose-phosphatase [Corticibacterium sp. UT-5YL-CI-8]|nr:trehalose-phosphatase [Tianweitania sp. UT-5YL-CI-8]
MELLDLKSGDVALFLDIDGTLLEHQPHPEGVVMDEELRALMLEADKRLNGAVALVTGRSIAMVDRLFGDMELPTAGLYGLEHRLEKHGPVTTAGEPEDLTAVADQLQEEFHTTRGIYFERKGAVLAIHTRAAPHSLPQVKAASERALKKLGEKYRLLAGHAGVEFLPLDALKSAAIRRFMDLPTFAGRRPVFLGDDTADETGFEFVNELGGVSIRVRPEGPTAAQHTIENVAAARRFIGELLAR